MAADVQVEQIDAARAIVRASDSILQELSDYFSYEVPNAKFMPAFKRGWDGIYRLFNTTECTLLVGLVPYLRTFCAQKEYTLEEQLINVPRAVNGAQVAEKVISQLFEADRLSPSKNPRPYQRRAVGHAASTGRCVLLSPTGSGKSLIIYLIGEMYSNRNKLIIVPTVNLVNQMEADLIEYGCDASKINKIFAGRDKDNTKRYTITTWQSIYKLPQSWFNGFEVLIGDEAHTFKATSLQTICGKMANCHLRFGTSGTLDNAEVNKMVLEGLFGPVYNVTRTRDLIEDGTLADFDVSQVLLTYEDLGPKQKPPVIKDHQSEVRFLAELPERNTFIAKMMGSLPGQRMALFNNVAHGESLYKRHTILFPDQEVYLVHGGVKPSVREDIRLRLNETPDANIAVYASFGTFSTGMNAPNLSTLILTSPAKSVIRVLQSVGRVLRRSATKSKAVLYDIGDNFGQKKPNIALRHYWERASIYGTEGFNVRERRIKLK